MIEHKGWNCWGLCIALWALAWPCLVVDECLAEGRNGAADVVVVVDTSVSMSQPGMDPERTSLLVTQLLSDVVPGELSVIRLLDLVADSGLLPSRETGRFEPCAEDPQRQCALVEPASDWDADARSGRLGVLSRPFRGDDAFAKALEGHLAQRSNNSPFHLAFRAAQGVMDLHREAGKQLPKTVLWLSDGRSDDESSVLRVLGELHQAGVGVEAIIFGQGDPSLAENAGLAVRRVEGPAELMRAFAGAFRRVIQAPYELDARLADTPTFTMQPGVDEAWVVVYGTDDLRSVHLERPDGQSLSADYAARRWPRAGAYRVAHLEQPSQGVYRVHAEGGGSDVAFAVVQWSSLAPRYIEPTEVVAGVEVELMAEVTAGILRTRVADPKVLAETTLTAELLGSTKAPVGLEQFADGTYGGKLRFPSVGEAVVRLHLSNPVAERTLDTTVNVTGLFRPLVESVELDLGTLTLEEEVCRPLPLEADHQGDVEILLERTNRLPVHHRLFLRLVEKEGPWNSGESRVLSPRDSLEVCLRIGSRAPSSESSRQPWLRLGAAGSAETLTCRLSWTVEGLGFWGRWGRWILAGLGILLIGLIIAGFIVPHRFPPSLALVYVDDRQELDEQQPQPLRQWKGVRIGFYRDARAHLQNSFWVSGKARGALASLVAEQRGARVMPGKGMSLSRETLDGEWEGIAPEGRRVRAGDVYRIGEEGPFFRVALRGGRGG